MTLAIVVVGIITVGYIRCGNTAIKYWLNYSLLMDLLILIGFLEFNDGMN